MATNATTNSSSEGDPVFEHPFTYADADVILRSSDGVEFKTHKCILSIASPFFKDLFSLPQIDTSIVTASSLPSSALPVIDVTEAARTVCDLLRLLYPIPDPDLDSINEVAALMATAQKYQMKEAESISQDRMMSFALSDPVRAYALGCHYKMSEIAQAAARACCNLPLPREPIEELRLITAMEFCRLLNYHESQDSRNAIFESYKWVPKGTPLVSEENGIVHVSWIAR